jgi:hypothetical protein
MDHIDQSRFALIAVLSAAHHARPDEYLDPGGLVAMSDEGLRAYAVGLLHLMDGMPGDRVAAELEKELRLILEERAWEQR